MKKNYQVIVIGAGHNGLTTAALLARKGRQVLVVERCATPGGMAASEQFHPGYHSPGLLHETACVWPSTLQQLQLHRYGLQHTSQSYPMFFPQRPGQGPGLLLSGDITASAHEIAQFSEVDAKQYQAFRSWLQTVQSFVQSVVEQPAPPLLHSDVSDLWSLFKTGLHLRRLGKHTMMELLRVAPMPVGDWLNEWFSTDLLKAGLAAPALYGSYTGPRSPGSNMPFLLHECTARFPIHGGAPALIQALVQCNQHLGVEILTQTEVSQILVQNERVRGIRTQQGEDILAPVVVSSADPKHTLLTLLRPQDIPANLEYHIQNYRMRGTTAKMNLALSGPLRFACRPAHPVVVARVGETLQTLEQSFDAVKYRQYSKQPILDIFVPTELQSNLAPQGHHVASILIHFVPYHLQDGWTPSQKEQLTQTVLQTLSQYVPDLSDRIVAHETLTPVDLEQRYGLTHGHIYHGELALDQWLVRPVPGCERYNTPIHGLFLGGNGSFGGTGITCGPGTLAAQAVLSL